MLESAVAYLESLDATDADGITGALENLKRTLFDLQKKADDMGVWHVVAPAVDDAVKLVVKLDEKTEDRQIRFALNEIEAIMNGLIRYEEAKPEYIQKYAVNEGMVQRINGMVSFVKSAIRNCRKAIQTRQAASFKEQNREAMSNLPSYSRQRTPKKITARDFVMPI